MVRDAPARPPPPRRHGPPPYPAEKARGGEIILRTPRWRLIFIAGLVGLFALALLWATFF